MKYPLRIFVDASVILMYLLPSTQTKRQNITILLSWCKDNNITICSVPLLYSEVTNGLRFILKNSALAHKYYEAFLSFPIEIYSPTIQEYESVLDMAYKNKTTIFDSLYHYAAILHVTTLYTLDFKYYEKARLFGHIKLVP
jgi:predicted nucleic acid-binding protein